MYNPSRGGVRGGADQFTWESVKNDKHRENYLGHSVMAPVGRWQKGKDLSWYAKERKDGDAQEKSDKSELASIKQAEEEAMLIALGHNITRKESQKLSKEEMREALKRNMVERDDRDIERIDGVGASSKRLALLSNTGNNFKKNREGVAFEGNKRADVTDKSERQEDSSNEGRKRNKKSKKLKKEKKHKKHRKESCDSDSSEDISKHRTKHKKSESESDYEKSSSKHKSHKTSKHKHENYLTDNTREKHRSNQCRKDKKRHKERNELSNVKRRRHDSSDSD